MKKILILANSSGGLYDFRNELVLKLLKEHEVAASLPDTVKTKELSEEGCRIIHTPINRRGMNPIQDGKLLLRYFRLLKKEKPDLVLTYTIKPNIYGGLCCRMLKIPYITTITGLGAGFHEHEFLRKVIIVLYRIAMKKASCIFFQNNENKEVFETCGIRGKKTRLVMGSGVNLQKHTFEEYPHNEKTIFLFLGRMMHEKGVDELLEAVEVVNGPDVEFRLVGYSDAEDLNKPLEEAAAKGYITRIDFDPNVHEHLKQASALVHPTRHEGMSNVLMEAAATGRPIIATGISGCVEILEDGVNGFYCKLKDSNSLVEALRKFMELSYEERAEMGRKSREKVEREFDRMIVVEHYYEEIQSILTEKE